LLVFQFTCDVENLRDHKGIEQELNSSL
jgi:hypothetical protein